MSVLTFKSDEYKTFPPILKEYASYVFTIKGNSERTVCEYLLDLRTFFRYYLMQKQDLTLKKDEFEELSIKSISLDDVRAVTPDKIIEFLMFTNFERDNNNSTRMRKLSSLRSFYHYVHGKKH